MDIAILTAVVSCPLGRLLVAATSRGVCAIRLGCDDRELLAGLRREFPYATLRRDPLGLEAYTRPLCDALAGRPARLDLLPLDVRGSRFQRRVWEALRAIRAGETRTYGEVAAAVGSPGAARAVGRACARNPVPLVVPCHRVVPAGRGVGGYRFGTDRKRWLLAREGAIPAAGPEDVSAPAPAADQPRRELAARTRKFPRRSSNSSSTSFWRSSSSSISAKEP